MEYLYAVFLITRDINEIINEIKENGEFNNYLPRIDEESDASIEDYMKAFHANVEKATLNSLEEIREKIIVLQTAISKIIKLWKDYH